ncbi:ABC transporter ATP-binding protein [Conexibacter woesei]|uniref:Oligopeptide/dipeptide ABC transporter, ATPase subunit n=1 Tax=Conexibacter woesei (strain DSM 14684 / CCUG 47730 / CIP 108061 / JCM 11494 / NBRC 100937 / ID131577) TaxID=469383 RepID=D3FBV2_CONWI|nr:ABC transporter ATP-binding protein [Conexibacter woesei]ADB51367.1 oligopeptide/dipeptide ABC transporter, ATPase subunit [Conexibacter woesei DSM 14684]
MNDPLLSVRDLHVEFRTRRGTVRAVRGLSYDVCQGEAVGLVGESGSGKSVSALAVLGLLPRRTARIAAGSIRLRGDELVGLGEKRLRALRGAVVSLIFQDPLSSLNPVLTIGRQITEQLEAHGRAEGAAARARAVELLEQVGIPDAPRRVDQHPHELSGGMRQRAMIAMALSCEPALLIADEPTTALDVTIQAQILELLAELRETLGMSLLLITHDLGVVAGFTDRVAVMYAGRIVEQGPTEPLLARPAHPYAQGLLASIPRLDRPRQAQLTPIPGVPPNLGAEIAGCPFRPRCAHAVERCAAADPPLEPLEDAGWDPARSVACWRPRREDPAPDAAAVVG